MLVTANIFQPLIDVFETVLKFFHGGGISWGWSIVLLTIAVRAILIPLTFRQIKSMVRMQGLQPQMKEIQQKYKEDKQRQQQEVMKFYKENNVNPLSSCLPMVLQLPVFVSLYYMLRKNLRGDICPGVQRSFQKAYALAHHVSVASAAGQTKACGSSAAGTHFLFISDLTAKATGIELGILIVLYIGSQLGSTLVMSGASMDPTQRKIMMFMPLIFVLFVIRFPAGLLLYWITTNLWTVAQQYTVRRYIGPTQAAVVPAGGGAVATNGGSGPVIGSGGSGSGGGFGARMRERLASAQSETQGGGGSSGDAKSSTATKAPTAKPSSKPSGGQRSRTTNGNGNGNRNGAASGSGAPPPRPPRKRKKRSGRRR